MNQLSNTLPGAVSFPRNDDCLKTAWRIKFILHRLYRDDSNRRREGCTYVALETKETFLLGLAWFYNI
jgi:hypothetical protein